MAPPPLPDYARNTLIRAYQAARAARFDPPAAVPAMGPAQPSPAPAAAEVPRRPEFGPTRPSTL